jgi:hypothetical protein
MAELNRQHRSSEPADSPASVRYPSHGRPSIEELMAAQDNGPIGDVSTLHGDFWPEDEHIEDFLEALHEWRGHKRPDPVA